MTEWKDISSAPRDYHSTIIAARQGQFDSVGEVQWRNGRWQLRDGTQWKDGWLTHWMPLPPPPKHHDQG